MSGRKPEQILLRRQELTVLQRLLCAARPEEGCALLLGDSVMAEAAPAAAVAAPSDPEAWDGLSPQLSGGTQGAWPGHASGSLTAPPPAPHQDAPSESAADAPSPDGRWAAWSLDARPGRGKTAAPASAGEASRREADPPPCIWRIRLVWPCLNVWQPAAERRRRFCLDPREQLLAQRWSRQRGLQVLGSAHSHPVSAAVPSTTDLQLAVCPTLMLILSPLDGWAPACWWLEQGDAGVPTARPLQWTMVD